MILPYGSFILQVNVYDSNGGQGTIFYDYSCNILVKDTSSNCSTLYTAITNLEFNSNDVISTTLQYLQYFQNLNAILEYLLNSFYDDSDLAIDSECILNGLTYILDSIYSHFRPRKANICSTGFPVVCCL